VDSGWLGVTSPRVNGKGTGFGSLSRDRAEAAKIGMAIEMAARWLLLLMEVLTGG